MDLPRISSLWPWLAMLGADGGRTASAQCNLYLQPQYSTAASLEQRNADDYIRCAIMAVCWTSQHISFWFYAHREATGGIHVDGEERKKMLLLVV